MTTWWADVGATSLLMGMAFGLAWALWSTSQRRQKYLRAAIRPVGQGQWFLLQLCGMSAYLTLVAALGLAAIHDQMPATLALFLIAMSAIAFVSAAQFTSVETPRAWRAAPPAQYPPADPPVVPLRRSA
jgi:hypothetical protein